MLLFILLFFSCEKHYGIILSKMVQGIILVPIINICTKYTVLMILRRPRHAHSLVTALHELGLGLGNLCSHSFLP